MADLPLFAQWARASGPAVAADEKETCDAQAGVFTDAARIAGTAEEAPSGRLALAPEELHPALWFAHQVARPAGDAWPTGFAALDAELPGGGWPRRVLTELLLPHPGIGEIRLLAPTLVAAQRGQRCVMLFDPPAAPSTWALAALGLDVQRLLVVRGRDGLRGPARALLPSADMLWALEQSLKSGHVGAILAWLPARLRADALRRLQLAAQAHDGVVFVLRDAVLRSKPSAAPLRLLLQPAGPDALRLNLLKRRGPPLAQPLLLQLAPVLAPSVQARARRTPLPRQAVAPASPLRAAQSVVPT